MKVSLDFTKTVEENAQVYFEKAKKARKKSEGAREAVARYEKKLAKQEESHEEVTDEQIVIPEKIKREWYEKFRWFVSSEGFLVIGGRDATTNEIVIKKHTDKEDLVFHTDMAGSPFFVIKVKEKISHPEITEPTDVTIIETAQATASFSRAWKLGLSSLDVFCVSPEQVTKEAQSGEYLPKGAFMIRGKTRYVKYDGLKVSLGFIEGRVISGPPAAISAQTSDYFTVIQGRDKSSDVAKKFRSKFGGRLDDIIRMLPSGGMQIVK